MNLWFDKSIDLKRTKIGNLKGMQA